MCEFISWKKVTRKDGEIEILFLTHNDIYNTKRGKELQKLAMNSDRISNAIPEDLVGHGAIDFFYKLNGKGVDRECTDFSTPDNFPPVIANAIKAGKFYMLGTPEGLLSKSAWTEYEKIEKPALTGYEKIREAARSEYDKIQRAAWAEYEKIRGPALAEYEKIQREKFWGLFSDVTRRAEQWK